MFDVSFEAPTFQFGLAEKISTRFQKRFYKVFCYKICVGGRLGSCPIPPTEEARHVEFERRRDEMAYQRMSTDGSGRTGQDAAGLRVVQSTLEEDGCQSVYDSGVCLQSFESLRSGELNRSHLTTTSLSMELEMSRLAIEDREDTPSTCLTSTSRLFRGSSAALPVAATVEIPQENDETLALVQNMYQQDEDGDT